MEKWPEKKEVLSLTILTVIPLLFLVVAFTWESTGVNPLNLLIPHQQLRGGENLSNSAQNSVQSYAPDIAAGGTEIYVVWKENTVTNAKIHFKESTDGSSWPSGNATDLTDGDVNAERASPAIAVKEDAAGDDIHVVWQDHAGGDKDILYRKSTDGATNWSPALGSGAAAVTTDSSYDDFAPDIAVSGAVPYVVWHRNDTIFYSKNSESWTDPVTVSVSTSDDNKYPAIAGSGHIHVVWDVFTGTNTYHIVQYRRSEDGGTTWIGLENVSGDIAGNEQPTHPDIAARGDDIYVVWNTLFDEDTYRYKVWCRRSSDGGGSWLSATNIATPSTSFLTNYPTPRVSIDISGTVHVVWNGTGSDSEIWYSSSENGTDWSTPTNLSNEPQRGSWLASIAIDSSNQVHVVWQEEYQDESAWKDIYWVRTDLTGGGIYLPVIMKNY